jgi:hypothetical protein
MASAIITGIRNPKIPGPGAVAHMSLHLNQQYQRTTDKNRRTTSPPRFLLRGTAVRLCWRPSRKPFVRNGVPVGGAAYMEGVGFGQTLFAEILQKITNSPLSKWIGWSPKHLWSTGSVESTRARPVR